MAYNNDNSGVLFRNKRKEKDTHPTHTGSITVGGVDYWVSAWVKEKNGEKYFSMAVKPKDEAATAAARANATAGALAATPRPAPATTAAPKSDLDDEIPW